MEAHIANVHSDKSELEFECKHCELKFRLQSEYHIHCLEKHRDTTCKECGMVFKRFN